MTDKKANQSALSVVKKGVVDIVAGMIQDLVKRKTLHLPQNYSADNAMKEAWLVLQDVKTKDGKLALEHCDKNSIANALLSMVVQGLNVGKEQGYFIPYGKTLTFMRSYLGSMAVTKMVDPRVKSFSYKVVYESDKFSYELENGKIVKVKHEQGLDNIDKDKIKGAYCMALDENGKPLETEVMTFAQIKQSWKQSKLNPVNAKDEVSDTSTHGKFTAQMAIRTVVNRLCKLIYDTSDDAQRLDAILKDTIDQADEAEATAEIEEHANLDDVIEIPHEAETAPEEHDDGVPEDAVETGDPLDPPQGRTGEEVAGGRPVGEPGKLGPGF